MESFEWNELNEKCKIKRRKKLVGWEGVEKYKWIICVFWEIS